MPFFVRILTVVLTGRILYNQLVRGSIRENYEMKGNAVDHYETLNVRWDAQMCGYHNA